MLKSQQDVPKNRLMLVFGNSDAQNGRLGVSEMPV